MILKGNKSLDFIDDVKSLSKEEIQMKLAKLTGQYKYGNEKDQKVADLNHNT